MKRWLILSSLIFHFVGFSLCGQSSEDHTEIFKQANKAYLEGEYSKAIESFTALTSQGYNSTALFYNLGNAYMKNDKLAQAILHYEKALKLSPNDEDIKNNLELAKEKVDTPVLEIPDFLPLRIWKSIASGLSANLWMVFQILLGIAILVGVYLWRISLETSKRSRGLLIVVSSLILFLFCYAAGRTSHSLDTLSEVGIIMDKTSLMGGPEKRSEEKEVLHPGVKVKIMDRLDDWYQVQLMNKDEGWVSQEVVEMI